MHFEDKGMFPKLRWRMLEDSGRFLARISRGVRVNVHWMMILLMWWKWAVMVMTSTIIIVPPPQIQTNKNFLKKVNILKQIYNLAKKEVYNLFSFYEVVTLMR